MSAIADEIHQRVAQALASLAEALHAGDEYLVRVRVGELEELARTAAENDIALPGLDADLAAARDTDVVDLPEAGPAA